MVPRQLLLGALRAGGVPRGRHHRSCGHQRVLHLPSHGCVGVWVDGRGWDVGEGEGEGGMWGRVGLGPLLRLHCIRRSHAAPGHDCELLSPPPPAVWVCSGRVQGSRLRQVGGTSSCPNAASPLFPPLFSCCPPPIPPSLFRLYPSLAPTPISPNTLRSPPPPSAPHLPPISLTLPPSPIPPPPPSLSLSLPPPPSPLDPLHLPHRTRMGTLSTSGA